MTTTEIRTQILNEVGEGRLSVEEALEELEQTGVAVGPGYLKSLLAFGATSILVEGGYDHNGQPVT